MSGGEATSYSDQLFLHKYNLDIITKSIGYLNISGWDLHRKNKTTCRVTVLINTFLEF